MAAMHHHQLLLLLLLLTASPYAGAQPTTPSDDNYSGFGTASFNSTTAIVLVVLVSAFCLFAFLSIYFRRCSFHRHSASDAVRVFAEGGRRSRRRGLDPALLETFPTMVYSEVKGLRTDDKVALECAVCLSEFGDEETLRMLPGCSHAFHPSCIDTWLASHVTCPVCRSILTDVHVVEEQDDAVVAEEVGIDVDTGGEEEQEEEVERAVPPAARFPRSHTTGHSVEQPRPRDVWERYTLRLPEHVKKEIVAAGKLPRASSGAGLPDRGEASGRRIGEGSSRGGRSMRMGGRSDRWAPAFLVRAHSARVVPTWRRGEGEGERKNGEAAAAAAAAAGVASGGDAGRSDSGEGDRKSSMSTPPDSV